MTARLRHLLRGIRRSQSGSMPPRPPRIPLSLRHLQALFIQLQVTRSPGDAACLRAALCLGFFGLLRVSEFTCPSATFYNPSVHLGLQDISFSTRPDLIHVRIKTSKTDPFSVGHTIRVARTRNYFCPFDVLMAFLLVRPRRPGPLFMLSDGSFLTRIDIHSLLRQTFPLVDPVTIGTHSLRIGGASMLCSLGVPDATIQILGRWSSDAFRRYLRISDQSIARIHASASGHHFTVSSQWSPFTRFSAPTVDSVRAGRATSDDDV